MFGLEGPSSKEGRSYKRMSVKAALSFFVILAYILICRFFRINSGAHITFPLILSWGIWTFPAKIRPTKEVKTLNWQNGKLDVKARMLSKFLWMTASIDVYLDGFCILKTGGQLTTNEKKKSEFQHNGENHVVELCWTPPRNGMFYPFRLEIDEQIVDSAEVYVRNWPMNIVGALIIVGIIFGGLALLIDTHH